MNHPATVEWTKSGEQALASIDRQIARRLREKVARWAATGAGDWAPLVGEGADSRLRMGKWRVVFVHGPNDVVYAVGVDNRDSIYS